MSMMLLAFALGAAAPIIEATRTMNLRHEGALVEVRYDAAVDLKLKQVGSSAPTRLGVVRCDWTADIKVLRSIGGSDLPGRELATGEPMHGSRPGSCMTTRKAITAIVAAQRDNVEKQLAAVVDRDRTQLLAELAAAHSLASTD